MKEIQENLTLFISEQKSYFETVLAPNENNLKWGEAWIYNRSSKGFLIGPTNAGVNFKEILITRSKALFREDESYEHIVIEDGKTILIDTLFSDFTQAFLVYKLRQSGKYPSAASLVAPSLLLKRIYVRLLMSGVKPSPCNISSETLNDTAELLATFRKQSTLADDQTYLNGIAEVLRKKQITYSEPEFMVTVKRPQRASTKKVREAEFAEGLGDEENEKLVEIQDFLNVVSLRNLVQKDSEKIMLNMTLLLFVTAWRFEELSGITINALKRLEVEDEQVRKLLKKRGLHTYYLGIVYQGKKGAGMRTHWVEPLAIDLVEFIFKDTIKLTKNLRNQVVNCRGNNFKTLLPQELVPKESTVVNLNEAEIELADVVAHIYESTSDSIRYFNDLKRFAKEKLRKAGFLPHRIVKNRRKREDQFYTLKQIDDFLKQTITKSKELSADMIYRVRDSSNDYSYDVEYEKLLFITPVGSTALNYSGMIKPLATPIWYRYLSAYLGMGINRNTSIFTRYNLKTKNGEFTKINTHMPRHNKNTFLAIADVSEHLQAMVMGRADIKQNERYQHLAIEELALTTDIVSYHQDNSCTAISLSPTGVDQVKNTGIIGLNPDLKLENALAQNLHTFTTERDRTSFITDMLDDIDLNIFEEFSDELAAFQNDNEKRDIIRAHSDLSPLAFGSCMRKISVIECPFNIMCQDGTACPYHTLTGRADEADKVASLLKSIESEIEKINYLEIIARDEADELLEVLNARKENVKMLSEQSQSFEAKKIPVNLQEYDAKKKPIRLATLFAVEHRTNEKRAVLEKLSKPSE
ncbi:hypothetical protein Shal_2191 [Shewanella halifaxensis HAW-EB4]|uniref:Integrase n=1 Tax=Shewanella halifaxensis (strain HAW-EB4) TaxID=458817 RepID=B0TUM2_SHEHH|nr:hypothetical protein [Shewanella halifaxensis]ABZ76750.1 hypothetical protein Shal_2191 [Shewanella halifaxensis HAW-EB4]